MGQTQMLLLVLVLILIAVATFAGIEMFKSWADTSNLEAVTNDLLYMASRAQEYYMKPAAMGGGANSFNGLTIAILTDRPENENGAYSIVSADDDIVVIKGEGNRDSDKDGTNVIVHANVFADSVGVEFINK